MTKLVLEFHHDRRRTSRQINADWGRDWKPDAAVLGAQISEQMRSELEQHVNEIATSVRATPSAKSVHVFVDVVRKVDEAGQESESGTYLASAIAIVDAPIVRTQIRTVAETVAAWNRLYVLPTA